MRGLDTAAEKYLKKVSNVFYVVEFEWFYVEKKDQVRIKLQVENNGKRMGKDIRYNKGVEDFKAHWKKHARSAVVGFAIMYFESE